MKHLYRHALVGLLACGTQGCSLWPFARSRSPDTTPVATRTEKPQRDIFAGPEARSGSTGADAPAVVYPKIAQPDTTMELTSRRPIARSTTRDVEPAPLARVAPRPPERITPTLEPAPPAEPRPAPPAPSEPAEVAIAPLPNPGSQTTTVTSPAPIANGANGHAGEPPLAVTPVPASPRRQGPPNPARARVEAVRISLENGTDVNEKDDHGRTLLQRAAINGELEVAEFLLSWGANVKTTDRQGWTALHWAASSGHQEIAELLIASGSEVSARGWLGDSPLFWAATFDRREVAELLLVRGADANEKDKRGRTPLHAAAERDAKATAELLISRGAEASARDDAGLTPLHASIAAARTALIDAAAARLASDSPDAHDSPAKIVGRARDMADLLAARGADVNARTTSGLSALHLSAWDDTRPLLEVLIARGADLNAADAKGRTPLALARDRGQKKAAELLVSKGGK